MAGAFPLGRRLAEEPLAAALGVSRTPVREALSRLHAEGLVERHGGGGYTPAAVDLHTSQELYEVRFALELDALRRPLRTGVGHDVAALEALRADWEALEPPSVAAPADPDFVLVDEDFHVQLAAASGNAALVEVLQRLNERIRPVRMHDFLTPERVARTIDQHLSVVRAVLDRDLSGAEARLVAHFEESMRVVSQRAAAALARMVSASRGAW
jgi:DNA-binding GntR family transcriptional regulator